MGEDYECLQGEGGSYSVVDKGWWRRTLGGGWVYCSDLLMGVGTWEDLWTLVVRHQRRCTKSHYENRLER